MKLFDNPKVKALGKSAQTASKKLIKSLKYSIYPYRCPYCDVVIEPKEVACPNCLEDLEFKNLAFYIQETYFCVCPFYYRGIYAESALRFKFRRRYNYAPKLAFQMARCLRERRLRADVITCVPLGEIRLRQRGYNQSELLARELSDLLSIPYEDLLIKVKDNTEQHKCSSIDERFSNVAGAYNAINTDKIKRRKILIVDDIITSGSTLGECCNTLWEAGARKIYCATAFAVKKKKR